MRPRGAAGGGESAGRQAGTPGLSASLASEYHENIVKNFLIIPERYQIIPYLRMDSILCGAVIGPFIPPITSPKLYSNE